MDFSSVTDLVLSLQRFSSYFSCLLFYWANNFEQLQFSLRIILADMFMF